MKTLYFTRHAKSSWKHDLTDHQRPLKKRGFADAKLVSKAVAKAMPMPDVMITSDAVRALTTAKFFKEAYDVNDERFLINSKLYDFSGQDVMQLINELDKSLNCVMLFGHNHAFTSIVNMLGNVYIDNLPTCGFVAISFQIDSWKAINTGTTTKTIFPRDLK